MSSTEAPNWWADVQQERDDLAGPGRRPAEDWLGEEIDFVPRRRITRTPDESARTEGAGHPLHGVFVPAAPHAPVRDTPTSMTIELGGDVLEPIMPASPADVAHELAHLSAADDPFASPPPPAGTRRTVQIKGRPDEVRMASAARRHRPRTASDRVGPRPDRIALWAVALGAVLILLAAMTSSSQAAVAHRAATAPAVTAKISHTAHHAPAGLVIAHR
ncbi:MAG TPA: hypothetical protein VK501_19595 [Baekduia sp.]|uniref:hypothetical protein n=1 Tax=Baekduia sp. TaxID=2600305 RepID=UPI002BD24591|nr:hypothetical protein [Baekduia sp.]HMJ36118.1 hypothetical protein [Baekduia sp.]